MSPLSHEPQTMGRSKAEPRDPGGRRCTLEHEDSLRRHLGRPNMLSFSICSVFSPSRWTLHRCVSFSLLFCWILIMAMLHHVWTNLGHGHNGLNGHFWLLWRLWPMAIGLPYMAMMSIQQKSTEKLTQRWRVHLDRTSQSKVTSVFLNISNFGRFLYSFQCKFYDLRKMLANGQFRR